jgi:hypothetical protein
MDIHESIQAYAKIAKVIDYSSISREPSITLQEGIMNINLLNSEGSQHP